jgi:hypothetical protein
MWRRPKKETGAKACAEALLLLLVLSQNARDEHGKYLDWLLSELPSVRLAAGNQTALANDSSKTVGPLLEIYGGTEVALIPP